jgi:hypothetical protein
MTTVLIPIVLGDRRSLPIDKRKGSGDNKWM